MNFRMTNLQAAIGCAQLEQIERFIARKLEMARPYGEGLKGLPLRLPHILDQGLSYLHHMLRGGERFPFTTNRTENFMEQFALRLKMIGRRWSLDGGLNMLDAILISSLDPDRYDNIKRSARGEL